MFRIWILCTAPTYSIIFFWILWEFSLNQIKRKGIYQSRIRKEAWFSGESLSENSCEHSCKHHRQSDFTGQPIQQSLRIILGLLPHCMPVTRRSFRAFVVSSLVCHLELPAVPTTSHTTIRFRIRSISILHMVPFFKQSHHWCPSSSKRQECCTNSLAISDTCS